MGAAVARGFRRYRGILRRRIPEPFLALLCFIWGLWLYDGWFGKNGEGGADDLRADAVERQALMLDSLDRTLRIGDELTGKPVWVGYLVGQSDRGDSLDYAVAAFAAADAEGGGLNPRARVIEELVRRTAGEGSRSAPFGSETDSVPELPLVRAVFDLSVPAAAEWQSLAKLLGTPDARWWHLEIARRLAGRPDAPESLAEGIRLEEAKNKRLTERAMWARGGVAMVGVFGLFGVPAALRLLRRSVQPRPRSYPDRWPMTLVLAIFLIGELAGIGLTVAFGVVHSGEAELPLGLLLPLDTMLRVVPAVIAAGLFFARPSHLASRLGMLRPFKVLPMLGLFAMLLGVNEVLLIVLDRWIPMDPTGGLDAGEKGLGGLFFLLFSACLVAPVAEETLYRGVLFRGTANRLGVLPAALLSSFLFALVHFYDIFGTTSVALLGFTCALAYRATGSLAAAIAFHAFYNLTVTLPDWIIQHSPL